MMKMQFSTKRIQINQANTQIVILVAVAAFIATFSLVASQSLLSKRSYQNKVIAKKEKAVQQLIDNKAAVTSLATAYKEFMDRPQNIIGGNPAGSGDRDGDNSKIILDALPSKYDFPAVTSSIEKIVAQEGIKLESIAGADDEVAQKAGNKSHAEPVEIPFDFSAVAVYGSMQGLLRNLELSIRPFEIVKISFKGSDAETTMAVTAKTYYLPAKSLSITKEVVE